MWVRGARLEDSFPGLGELFPDFWDFREAGPLEQVENLIPRPAGPLSDESGIFLILTIVSHELTEKQVTVPQPEKLKVCPGAGDGDADIPPFRRQDHLVFFEEMADVKTVVLEFCIDRFHRAPKVGGFQKKFGLSHPENGIDIAAQSKGGSWRIETQLKGRSSIQRQFHGSVQPAVEAQQDPFRVRIHRFQVISPAPNDLR